jgi:hypothetical protein
VNSLLNDAKKTDDNPYRRDPSIIIRSNLPIPFGPLISAENKTIRSTRLIAGYYISIRAFDLLQSAKDLSK